MTAADRRPGPRWIGAPPRTPRRAVVVAPHPDDEVLGCGLLLRWLVGHGVGVTIVAVTDGDRSHARSRRTTAEELRHRRAVERERALAALGVEAAVERLGLPDGSVAEHEGALADALAERSDPFTTLVATWRTDGHPDHEATGRAAHVAGRRTGASVWEVAVWGRVHRPSGLGEGRRLAPDPASARAKARAAACFGSQIRPLGPDPEDGPVVHPHELRRMVAGPEVVFVP